ncbi:MAG: phosphopyruvate hydratase [Patescibacteria group bacterium]
MATLSTIEALEILDSRGNPTLQVTVRLDDGSTGTAAVPSGASTGSHEALELRDGDAKRFGGKGVLQAVGNVTGPIASAVVGMPVADLRKIDETLIALDGTPNKSKLGANAILGVSLAAARAAAVAAGTPLYLFLQQQYGLTVPTTFPKPFCNVINGGVHAPDSGLSFQEFMLVPQQVSFPDQLRCTAEIFHTLGSVLKGKALSTLVGDEGGYAPKMRTNEEPLQLLAEAVASAGYGLGSDVLLAMDAAASELAKPDGTYPLLLEGKGLSADQLTALYVEWHQKYHLFSVEDGLAEDDWDHWPSHTTALAAAGMWVVGDDLFVTNVERLQKGIDAKVGNAILVKVNQIGTLSETIATIQLAQKHGYKIIVSHRSGETTDTTIADLAVAVGADGLKAGSMSRGERLAKYNRLLEIWLEAHA